MTKTIYQRKTELYRVWNELKSCMNDDTISFDKFMELKEQEEQAYYKWLFYDKFTKACNKLRFLENNQNKNIVRR